MSADASATEDAAMSADASATAAACSISATAPASPAPPPDAADTFPPPAETGGVAARRFHARYGRTLPAIDPAAGSAAPKRHPGAPVLALSSTPGPPTPSDDDHAPADASLEQLGPFLHLLNGVTRIDWTGDGVRAGRPVPSGGGAYPGEVYVATASGLGHHLPVADALELLSRADVRGRLTRALERSPAQLPDAVVVITTRIDANLARYGPFGHRLQALDTGVLTGQALSLLESTGAVPTAHACFAEAELGRVLGLNSATEQVHSVLTASPATGAAVTPVGPLLRRRSARNGFETGPVSLAALHAVLAEAARPVALDHDAPTDCALYVVAHRVTGLDAGCHRRDPHSGLLVPVAEGVTPRHLFPPGGPGELAGFEAACAVLVTGDYEAGYPGHGDRWYQRLNLRAGIIGQRIGLAAARAGLGAGLRCDVDTDAADAALRAHPDRTTLLAVLLGQERGSGTPFCPVFGPVGEGVPL
ncbi:hypothetical protein [Streptomyces sp. NPDC048111]|uniref:hypothetical protein n=1 Tax=Streptomyces sp. NPDC048111 TaxID=3365500 RepID=UPI003712DB19